LFQLFEKTIFDGVDHVAMDVLDKHHVTFAAFMGQEIVLPDGTGKDLGDLVHDAFALFKAVIGIDLKEIIYFNQE